MAYVSLPKPGLLISNSHLLVCASPWTALQCALPLLSPWEMSILYFEKVQMGTYAIREVQQALANRSAQPPRVTPGLERVRDDAHAFELADQLAVRFAEGAALRDRERQLPWEALDDLSASGLLTLTVPKSFGGPGLPYSTTIGVVDRLSRGDPSLGQLTLSMLVAIRLLITAGTPEQQHYFFAKILSGYRWGNASAEVGGPRTDTSTTRLTRVADSDDFQLDGVKGYSTGSLFSQLITIVCRDDEGRTVSAVIERDAPGLEIEDDWDGFGQRTTASGTLRLKAVRVRRDHVFHTEQLGKLSHSYGLPYLVHAAIDVGIARAALNDTVDYVQHKARAWRTTSLSKASDDPLVVSEIGRLNIRLEAAAALLDRASLAFDVAVSSNKAEDMTVAHIRIAEANVLAAEIAVEASSKLFQLCGASATRASLALDRHWRNARTHTVHDPVHWKVHAVGDYVLNGTAPRNGRPRA